MAVETADIMMKRIPGTKVTTSNGEHAQKVLASRDEQDLAHYGKRQQLRRNFGMISIIGLTCTLMITWEGLLFVFIGGFTNGGPTGLVWGYIFSWLGNIAQCLVMAEMGSMIPLAGGQYNWVAVLAPKSSKNFLSYVTGWVTVIGWQAVTASATLICGTMIQGLVILNHPEYVPERWQATLISYAVITISLFINTYLARLLPKIEALILVVHVVGFFAVLIPLVYFAPKGTTKDVFETFLNEGGWPSDGISFFIGSVSTMYAFIGLDAATHMAEEIENAAVVIPRSMIVTVILNGILGFAMLIAALFCLGDLEAVLTTPTGFPFIQIFYSATQSTGGATGMACITLVAFIFATVGVLATTSRMMWAFAREKGLPGHRFISQVDSRGALPLYAIGVTVVINLILNLVNIGSSVAFNALTGLTIAAFYASFVLGAGVMVAKVLTTPESEFRWGPFRLWSRCRLPVYAIAIAYSIIGFIFSFWPPTKEVTAVSMNWSSVVFFGSLALSMVYWLVHARHVYTGPIMEIHFD